MGREDRRADLRVEGRLRDHVPPGPEARLRRPDVQEHQGREQRPRAEDILREINRGGWSTGYCGQSPERLKAHMQNQAKFDLVTLRAPKDDPEVGGDYYGLPWPCWGKPEIRHPGSPILYNTNLHVKDGGSTFRARFGIERNGVSPAGRGLLHEGSELTDGYPEFTMAGAEEARLGHRPHAGGDGGHQADRRRQRRSGELDDRPVMGGIQRVASSMAARPTATARRGRWPGTCPIRSRSTASRSTRRGAIWWRSTRAMDDRRTSA